MKKPCFEHNDIKCIDAKELECDHLWDEYEKKGFAYTTSGNAGTWIVTKVFCKKCLEIKEI